MTDQSFMVYSAEYAQSRVKMSKYKVGC